MPFKLSDVSKHNTIVRSTQDKERWVAVANSALETCQSEGRQNCDVEAIIIANGVLRKQPNKRKAANNKPCRLCEYFELEYCTVYDTLVNEDDTCDSYMPVFSFLEKAIPQKYSGIDFSVTDAMVTNAKRALEKRSQKPPSERGMTPVGLARARDIIARKTLSPQTWRRMLSYFQRHEVDKQGSTWDEYGKGRQAWDGWGGDAGYSRARSIVNQMNNLDKTK